MGQGAFGEVRRCIDKRTSVEKAVKIIDKQNMSDAECEILEREIELLKEFDHPNIVKLYEAYKDQKRYFLVTELCTGGELFD